MKVENSKPTFVPMTITIESAGELSFFRDMLGATSASFLRAYGMEENHQAFSALNAAAKDNGLPTSRNPLVHIQLRIKD